MIRRIVRPSVCIATLLLAARAGAQIADAPIADATTREAAAAATTRPDAPTSRPAGRRARAPKPTMQHALERIEGDAMLRDGAFDHVALAIDLPPTTQPTTQPTAAAASRPAPRDGVAIVSPRRDFPLSGTWTSPTITTDFDFTELLPSWNAIVPDRTGVRFEVRVRDAKTADWSPWLYVGYWGRITRERTKTTFDGGAVDIDTLTLTRPADAFEVRATLMNYDLSDPRRSPTLRRVSAVYSRPIETNITDVKTTGANPTGAATRPTTTRSTTAPVALAVPFRAQGVEDPAIRGSICSPTSTTMILAWAGDALPTADNAAAIWDDDYALFGNWNRAVQFAGSLGYDAWLQRFETMDDVRKVLATGQPIVASIRFRRGEFPSNLQKSTLGHLIVIRGYDGRGNLLVNDPASRAKGEGVVYDADELAHAWLTNTGGVGYIIKKPG